MTVESPTGHLLSRVERRLRQRAQAALVTRITVGSRQVLVELDHPRHGRLAGVAHRPPDDPPQLADATVDRLVGWATYPEDGNEFVTKALGIATLNALSAPDIDWRMGDPMADLPANVGVVAMIGLFRPAFRKFDGQEIRIVEREPIAPDDLPANPRATVFPPEEASRALAGADVCFLSGSTLIYGGVGRYLSAVTDTRVPRVVIIGATSSLLPTPFFAAGIHVVAGARVDDVGAVRRGIEAGECGTDLHDRGLTKVYVTRPERVAAVTHADEASRSQAGSRGGPAR